jgi:hypothetical protein
MRKIILITCLITYNLSYIMACECTSFPNIYYTVGETPTQIQKENDLVLANIWNNGLTILHSIAALSVSSYVCTPLYAFYILGISCTFLMPLTTIQLAEEVLPIQMNTPQFSSIEIERQLIKKMMVNEEDSIKSNLKKLGINDNAYIIVYHVKVDSIDDINDILKVPSINIVDQVIHLDSKIDHISITEFKFIQLIFDKYGKIIKKGMHLCTEHTCPKFNMKRKIMISYENVIFF